MFCFVLFLGEFAHFSFYKLCVHLHVNETNLKEQFSGVLSHDLHWENKAHKLKKSVY